MIIEKGFVSLLLPFMLMSRLFFCQNVDDYDVLAELRLPRLLNRIFKAVMVVESCLVWMEVRFPCNGPLLNVARKEKVKS